MNESKTTIEAIQDVIKKMMANMVEFERLCNEEADAIDEYNKKLKELINEP